MRLRLLCFYFSFFLENVNYIGQFPVGELANGVWGPRRAYISDSITNAMDKKEENSFSLLLLPASAGREREEKFELFNNA